MRAFVAAFAMVCAGLLVSADANFAQDKKKEQKQVTLKGKITCSKCELMKSDKCETVIVVKNDKKKDVIYIFDAASHKKYHDDICTSPKNGTVTGTVKDADKKKVISVKKLTYE